MAPDHHSAVKNTIALLFTGCLWVEEFIVYVKRLRMKKSKESIPTTEQRQLSYLSPFVHLSGDAWRKPWTIKERKLLSYLLVYVAEGEGTYVVAGKTYDLTKGDLVWVPPDLPHEMGGHSSIMHLPWVYFDLVFSPIRSECNWAPAGGMCDLKKWKHLMHPPLRDRQIGAWEGRLRLPNHAAIGNLIQRVCFEQLFGGQKADLLLSGLMLQIVAEIMRGLALRTGDRNRG